MLEGISQMMCNLLSLYLATHISSLLTIDTRMYYMMSWFTPLVSSIVGSLQSQKILTGRVVDTLANQYGRKVSVGRVIECPHGEFSCAIDLNQ